LECIQFPTEAPQLKDLNTAMKTLSKFTKAVFGEMIIECSWHCTMRFCRLSCGKV